MSAARGDGTWTLRKEIVYRVSEPPAVAEVTFAVTGDDVQVTWCHCGELMGVSHVAREQARILWREYRTYGFNPVDPCDPLTRASRGVDGENDSTVGV